MKSRVALLRPQYESSLAQRVHTVHLLPTCRSLSSHLGYQINCPGIACVQITLILFNSGPKAPQWRGWRPGHAREKL